MTAWQLGCREGVLDPLLEEQLYQDMDLDVALESIIRVCLCLEFSRSCKDISPESDLFRCLFVNACNETDVDAEGNIFEAK